MKMDRLIPEKTNEGFLRFLDFKKAEIIEQNIVRAYTT